MITKFLIKKFIKNWSNVKDPSVRNQYGTLSGIIGMILNLILVVGKFIAGWLTSSVSVVADAFNNLSDVISSAVNFICFKASGNPADKKYPFGYGRIEYVSGLIVSILIIFLGLELLKASLGELFNPTELRIDTTSIIIMASSIILKLWMGLFNRKINKLIKSTAIKAEAFNSLSDCVVTATIIVGMIITYFTGISVDAYTGIIVSGFIIYTSSRMLKDSIGPLLGQAPDPKFVKEITSTIMESSDIVGIHSLYVHNYGPDKPVISLHAEVPSNKGIVELHQIIDDIENKLEKKYNCQTTIHIDPVILDDDKINSIKMQILKIVKDIDKSAEIHDLRIVDRKVKTIIFQVSISKRVKKSDEGIKKLIHSYFEKIKLNCKCMIVIDRV